jgi:biopolymer transport protein ExbD
MIWKKLLTVLPILIIGFYISACIPQKPVEHQSDASEWDNVDLPSANYFTKRKPSDPNSFSFTISKTGTISIYGAYLTSSNLVTIAKNRINKYGLFKTTLFVDKDAPFERFWFPIQRLRECGLWQFALAAKEGTSSNLHSIGVATFSAPVMENDSTQKGAIVIRAEDPKSSILLIIHVEPESLKLNNRAVSLEQLSQHFNEYAATLKLAMLVIVPAPKTSYSELIRITDLCAQYGLHNICIMEKITAQPSEPPYPEIKPIGPVSEI